MGSRLCWSLLLSMLAMVDIMAGLRSLVSYAPQFWGPSLPPTQSRHKLQLQLLSAFDWYELKVEQLVNINHGLSLGLLNSAGPIHVPTLLVDNSAIVNAERAK